MRKRSARREQMGSIAVEFGLALPILTLVLLGGISIGRTLITRHRLEDAVAYATRTAAVANQTGEGQIRNLVLQAMGNESQACAPLRTQAQVIPSAGPGIPSALEVTATCTLVPAFAPGGVNPIPQVDNIRVVVAMPLSN